MNAGRNGAAATGSSSPRKRSSFTRRSWRVPLARSTRPLASGLRAQRRLDIERAQGAAELREARATLGALAGAHVEDAQPIAVEGHRLPVLLEVTARGAEVVERRLDLGEGELHEPARRVVDVDEQGAHGP